MFNLKTASREVRKAVELSGIKSGEWEPINHDQSVDALPDEAVIARVYNRNHPNGVDVTAGDVRYITTYLNK